MAEPAKLVKRGGPRAAALVFAVLSALSAATPAAAQVCLGRPVGGLAARAVVGEAALVRYSGAGGDDGFDVGAAYWANPRGFIAYSAGYARRMLEGRDGHVARFGLAAELPQTGALPPGASTCFTAGVTGAWFDALEGGGEHDAVSFPIGAAVGFVVPLGPTARLHPYLHPRLVLGDTGDGAAAPSIEGGFGFASGPLVGRARVATSFDEAGAYRAPLPDLRAGLELGIRF